MQSLSNKIQLWKTNVEGQLSYTWDKANFSNVSIIVWRNHIIKVNVNCGFVNYVGAIITFKFNIAEQVHSYKIGSNQKEIKEIHNICNGTHFLKFYCSGSSIILKEVPVPRNKDIKLGKLESIFTGSEDALHEPYPYDQVKLFEIHQGLVTTNCFAYFQNEELIIDYGILGKNYEDEYAITVGGDNLILIYREFSIEVNNKYGLLDAIAEIYNDRDCFHKFENFLTANGIAYVKNTHRS